MIRTLQKKFVITAMIAITALLLFLLGVINIANVIGMSNEANRTMQIILNNENGKEPPMQRPPAPQGGPKNEYDTLMSSNYFIARFDASGQMIYLDVSRTSAVSESQAKTLAESVYQGSNQHGETAQFRYLIANSRIFPGVTIIFLDVSEERFSCIWMLLLSCAAGIVCWGVMLLFVILLSKKAIRPIAQTIEKQKQFVTDAGHEIKTPLAIIQSNTEAMELYQGETKWSKRIKEQTTRLSDLMNDLLLLAKMDEGILVRNETTFCISEVLNQTIVSFETQIQRKDIRLTAAVSENLMVSADWSQIAHLFTILLDNAVKYTESGGQIRISLEKPSKQTVLQIENTCDCLPGVAPQKLFDRFYRADDARTQKTGGYGIGLSIARSIAEANKLSLTASYLDTQTIRFTVLF